MLKGNIFQWGGFHPYSEIHYRSMWLGVMFKTTNNHYVTGISKAERFPARSFLSGFIGVAGYIWALSVIKPSVLGFRFQKLISLIKKGIGHRKERGKEKFQHRRQQAVRPSEPLTSPLSKTPSLDRACLLQNISFSWNILKYKNHCLEKRLKITTIINNNNDSFYVILPSVIAAHVI